MLRTLFLSFVVVLSSIAAKADPVIVPLPIESVVFVNIIANPIVTIGSRTIDFTPFLSQEFIAFIPVFTQVDKEEKIIV